MTVHQRLRQLHTDATGTPWEPTSRPPSNRPTPHNKPVRIPPPHIWQQIMHQLAAVIPYHLPARRW